MQLFGMTLIKLGYLCPMKLVTGATGLVGSHLLLELSNKGFAVRAMKRSGSDMSLVNKVFGLYAPNPLKQLSAIEWVEADLTDISLLEELLEGVDGVFHCAAVVSFHPSRKREMMLTNVKGTANVVNALLRVGGVPLCHVSSIAALGRSENNDAVTEENLWKNSGSNSLYSVSKYAAEREVWRGIAEGLEAVIVNPSVILGPGSWHAGSSELFALVWKGLKFYTPGINGYVDVRDVARAMVLLTEKKIYGQRFILSAANLSYLELFSMMAEGLGKPKPTIAVSPWMAEIAWRLMAVKGFFTGKTPAITRETARSSLARKTYSSEKFTRTSGMDFMPIRQSVGDICQIFLKDHAADH